jgi:hypothetical protein
MKFAVRILLCLLLAATTHFVSAQDKLTVSQALDFWITTTENQVVPAADAMPEGKYSFAPTNGEFAGVRTFAQQVKHLAANNYRMAAYIQGEKPKPDQESETGPGSDHGLRERLVRRTSSGRGWNHQREYAGASGRFPQPGAKDTASAC